MKGFCRCGLCDENFKSNEEWVRHSKGYKHKRLLEIWEQESCAHGFLREPIENARKIYEKEKRFVFR